MASHANQLTLPGVGARVVAEIRRVARTKGVSLNKAALSILERGAGVQAPVDQERRIGSSLDRFIGVWTAARARAFERSTNSVEQLDEKFWDDSFARHECVRRVAQE